MEDFLRKIHLVQDISIQLPISKIDFIQKFRNNVDESDLSFVPFEVFESSKNEYKGNILNNSFEFKKRRKFFNNNYSFAKVTGTFKEDHNLLIVNAEINGFKKRMLLFLGIMILFYLISIFSSIFLPGENPPFIFFPFLLFHMSLMIGIPYFVIRRSVKRMVYDVERDLHYWVTKN
jgi:pilus assembly protein TadC